MSVLNVSVPLLKPEKLKTRRFYTLIKDVTLNVKLYIQVQENHVFLSQILLGGGQVDILDTIL